MDFVAPHSSKIERIIYTSVACEALGTHDLFNLLNHARTKNASVGITGYLIYANGAFTQCIEGPADSVTLLLKALSTDTRHTGMQILEREIGVQRKYEDWSMAFSSYRYLNTLKLPGFFPLDEDGNSHFYKFAQASQIRGTSP